MKKGLRLAISIGKENYIEEAPKLALHTSAKNELYYLPYSGQQHRRSPKWKYVKYVKTFYMPVL